MDSAKDQFLEIVSSPINLWFALGLVLLFFAVVTTMLLYHWRKYSFESQHIAFAERIYLPISVIIIGFSIFSIIMYSTV